MTDRSVLGSCLLSGGLWLSPLVLSSEPAWPLFAMGAVYVGGASIFLAAAPTGVSRSITAWLVAVAIWTLLVRGIGADGSWTPWPVSLIVGGSIASLCFVVWQASARLLLQLASWMNGQAGRW